MQTQKEVSKGQVVVYALIGGFIGAAIVPAFSFICGPDQIPFVYGREYYCAELILPALPAFAGAGLLLIIDEKSSLWGRLLKGLWFFMLSYSTCLMWLHIFIEQASSGFRGLVQ